MKNEPSKHCGVFGAQPAAVRQGPDDRPASHWCRVVPAALLLMLASAWSDARSATLETWVLSIAGQTDLGNAGCALSSLPASHTTLFGASSGVFVPLPGVAACGLAGGYQQRVSPTGPLSDSSSLTTSFAGRQYSGSAQAVAQYGRLGAAAQAQFSGESDGLTVKGAEAYALLTDSFTLNSASVAAGSAGKLVFRFGIEGQLSTTAINTVSLADVQVAYATDAIFRRTLMHAQLNNTQSPATLFVDPVSGNDLSGFVSTPGGVTVDARLSTLSLDVVFGAPFDFTLGLQSWVQAAAPLSSVTVGFEHSVFFDSFEVTDAFGHPLHDVSISTASGIDYFPPVPEPASAALLAAGLAGLLAWRRLTRRS